MSPKAAKGGVALGVLLFLYLSVSGSLGAQESTSTLSGTINSVASAAIPNAKVSAKNMATGQTTEVQTDSAGHYSLANLSPGDYEVSVMALGYSSQTNKVTLGAGTPQKSDFVMIGVPGLAETAKAPPPGAPSLQDLGISPDQAQGSAVDQARLDKRSHMLKIHQRLGLIAAVPMIATVVTSFNAGGKTTSRPDRYLHLALGSATGDLYFMSAWYAIRAPKISGTETRGQIRFHKALMWIHGPGMILTPILGAMAFDQKSKGEKVHGIASAHGAVAIVTAGAYGLAILSVSMKF